jgi:toxin ParE1/3/4
MQLRVTGPARQDIARILKQSLQDFGEAAAERYATLLSQALADIAADPDRPGSRARPEIMISGARTYHLEFSRTRVSGDRVKEPRHFILYRQREIDVVEVGRILHDARELSRHLPRDYRK